MGAILLAVIGIWAFFQYQKQADQRAADAAAAATAAMQRQVDDLKSKQVTVNETQTNMRVVLFATQPVEPGVRISPAFYEKKLTPRDILPDAYSDADSIIGWFAIRKIEKGDPLTPRNIGKGLPYMSQRISPGMRAISLDVYNADYNRTGGFIVDGDKVDLLFTLSSADNNYKISTQTIMQSVSVLYVPGPTIKTEKTDGINPAPPPRDAVAVTFEVTPEQAQALIYLSSLKNGRFDMIMRARLDTAEIKVKPFEGSDYIDDLRRVQRLTDRSMDRVQTLAAEIDATEKSQANPAATNETNTTHAPQP
jgi:Flp pilus assembly protein CpaB